MTAKNPTVMIPNNPKGNSGTVPGVITTDVNSTPAKLVLQ